MKKIIFITLAMAFATTGVFAQGASFNYATGQPAANANAEARAKDATDRLNNLVQLTQDQYNQVLQVNRTYFSQGQGMGVGRGAARVNAGREQQLKSILNGDQWQTYQNAKAQGQGM